ncbi:homeobox protein 2-like [Oppia nitens]|uniref:homeobox protein 2-like n=1 Tax=Oppia nitens TaxID=1686743 RepID=UPI0023D97934|nr:homeobox protein 2-like [Oppia nitens]
MLKLFVLIILITGQLISAADDNKKDAKKFRDDEIDIPSTIPKPGHKSEYDYYKPDTNNNNGVPDSRQFDVKHTGAPGKPGQLEPRDDVELKNPGDVNPDDKLTKPGIKPKLTPKVDYVDENNNNNNDKNTGYGYDSKKPGDNYNSDKFPDFPGFETNGNNKPEKYPDLSKNDGKKPDIIDIKHDKKPDIRNFLPNTYGGGGNGDDTKNVDKYPANERVPDFGGKIPDNDGQQQQQDKYPEHSNTNNHNNKNDDKKPDKTIGSGYPSAGDRPSFGGNGGGDSGLDSYPGGGGAGGDAGAGAGNDGGNSKDYNDFGSKPDAGAGGGVGDGSSGYDKPVAHGGGEEGHKFPHKDAKAGNKVVDELLDLMKRDYRTEFDKLALSDVGPFKHGRWGSVTLKNGVVTGLTNIERLGNALVVDEFGGKKLIVTDIVVQDISADYKVSAKLFHRISIKNRELKLALKRAILTVRLEADKTNGKLLLKDIQLKSKQGFGVKSGRLVWPFNKLTDAIVKSQEPVVKEIVQKELANYMGKAIHNMKFEELFKQLY